MVPEPGSSTYLSSPRRCRTTARRAFRHSPPTALRGLGRTERLRGSHGRPGDPWTITRPAGARGRERCRPRVPALVFGLVRTVVIPTQEPPYVHAGPHAHLDHRRGMPRAAHRGERGAVTSPQVALATFNLRSDRAPRGQSSSGSRPRSRSRTRWTGWPPPPARGWPVRSSISPRSV